MSKIRKIKWTTTKIIAAGYLVVIALGTLLLMLPFSNREGTATTFMDAWFTATSATCVTGLVTNDTYTFWSEFGQVVILILIQIGGIGFMTIAISALTLTRKKIGLSERMLMQESVAAPQIGGIVRMSKFVLSGTLFFEGIGAVLLAFYFVPRLGLGKGIYYAVFHSISAFCNAGIDLMGYYSPSSSLITAGDSYLVSLTIAGLIIIGGIGFLVWEDLKKCKWKFRYYRLHTKMVIFATGVLIIGGTLLMFLFEWGQPSMEGKTLGQQILSAFFQAVTPRTAGFNTVDLNALTDSSQMLMVCLMFIGGSPGSTAGGIKTTTILVLMLTIWTELRKRKDLELFRRRVEGEAIRHACCLMMFYGLLSIGSSMAIATIENLGIKQTLFETVSALCTVGLSLGITSSLGMVSQVILILLMFIGRVGGITILIAFTNHISTIPSKLPVEKISVG
ncbi:MULTISPECIES: TrkH family potassium uptake protein [Blautia]|uniref:Trk family potassium uptake protein n=1 Tax=Blautia argi TaxID=1912897 RepID=A0A2Z4U8T3_9FIRM|nr:MULTISPECIES: TrkH family potassium uptake protein [Blautia]AWY97423.1 Trk family potassium uptake protein [Blautia argi]